MTSKKTALDAYLRRYGFIREKIEHLQNLADDHFGHDPDSIKWDQVDDLGRVETILNDLLAIFKKSRA